MRNLKPVFVCAALLLAAGCASHGPTTIARDRFDYSGALAESWKNQMLLNLVKMRYLDLPIYLEVGQIVSGYTVETSASAFGESGNSEAGTTFFGLGAKRTFTDRPTITYRPMTGQKFLESFLTPVPPGKVLSLVQAGYAADFILELSVDSLNGRRNQPVRMGAKHKADPEFFRVLALLRDIQDAGALSLRVDHPKGAEPASVIFFHRQRTPPDVLEKITEVRTLLGLESERSTFRLVQSLQPGSPDELAIATRSLAQMMGALALGVEVPPRHRQRKLAPTVPEGPPDETPLLRIHSGSGKPDEAFVAVSYEAEWFWIANDDWISKRTFSSLLFLFTLTDTGGSPLPVLTIPAQ